MARPAFVIRTVGHYLRQQPKNCPFCGSAHTRLLQRKKLLLELRRCQDCLLMYRYPKDSPDASHHFYQDDYKQGATTQLPTPEELQVLLRTNFAGSENDLSLKIGLVKRTHPRGRVLDYGCSWGYGVYQFQKAGFDAVGYEIGTARAAYGRQTMALEIVDSPAELASLADHSFDVIHCSHVLEHLPSLKPSFESFRRLLKPSGTLFIFVPNAGGEHMRRLGVGWGPLISESHCLALDALFFARNLPALGFDPVFASSPYEAPPVRFSSEEQAERELPGEELLVIAKPQA